MNQIIVKKAKNIASSCLWVCHCVGKDQNKIIMSSCLGVQFLKHESLYVSFWRFVSNFAFVWVLHVFFVRTEYFFLDHVFLAGLYVQTCQQINGFLVLEKCVFWNTKVCTQPSNQLLIWNISVFRSAVRLTFRKTVRWGVSIVVTFQESLPEIEFNFVI